MKIPFDIYEPLTPAVTYSCQIALKILLENSTTLTTVQTYYSYDDGYSNKGFFLPLNGRGILQRYRICTTVSPSGWPSLRSH